MVQAHINVPARLVRAVKNNEIPPEIKINPAVADYFREFKADIERKVDVKTAEEADAWERLATWAEDSDSRFVKKAGKAFHMQTRRAINLFATRADGATGNGATEPDQALMQEQRAADEQAFQQAETERGNAKQRRKEKRAAARAAAGNDNQPVHRKARGAGKRKQQPRQAAAPRDPEPGVIQAGVKRFRLIALKSANRLDSPKAISDLSMLSMWRDGQGRPVMVMKDARGHLVPVGLSEQGWSAANVAFPLFEEPKDALWAISGPEAPAVEG